jgi:hypothetical protein
MHQSQDSWPEPACASNPEGWSVDQGGGLPDWLRAIRTCVTECPLIQQCWEARNRQYPDQENPAGVIWAGVAYTETGQPLITQSALVEYSHRRDRGWREHPTAA